MDSADLTPEQLKQLAAAADRARLFYVRLVKRMEARRFHHNDPLYKLALQTMWQTQSLWIDLHYRSTGKHRDGMPPSAPPPAWDEPPRA